MPSLAYCKHEAVSFNATVFRSDIALDKSQELRFRLRKIPHKLYNINISQQVSNRNQQPKLMVEQDAQFLHVVD